jgi:hypothetical protein
MSRDGRSSTHLGSLADRLEPVRRAVLADARARADEIVANARREAREVVDRAERDVDEAVADAVRRSTIAARAHADQLRARAATDAHAEELSAREEIRQQLRDAVREAARGLPDDPRYPGLLDGLEARARTQLGPDARVERDPTGGIVAVAGSRRVDYSLPALAERAIEAHPEVVALWT